MVGQHTFKIAGNIILGIGHDHFELLYEITELLFV